jgi:arylsulfatase A-like enzyme
MRSGLAVLRITAPAGFLLGAARGAVPWHRAWPGLSILSAWKGAAEGWLVGLGLGLALGWAWSRRSSAGGRQPRAGWRRGLAAVLTALALAPAALWLTIALPGGLLRRAMASGRAPGDTRPNFILITIEALRPDRLGAYGSTKGLTPNLDAFAREASRYDAAYVRGPWTMPSLGALLTSHTASQCLIGPPAEPSPSRHTIAFVLAKQVPLLSERLAGAGYATAAELTNHFLSAQRGWSRGFDCFRNESTEEVPVSDLTNGDHVTARAWEWLRLNRREPFFLWMHYFDPHVPYDSPDTPAALRAQYPRGWVAHRRTWLEVMRYESEPTRSQYKEFYRRMYGEEVRYVDRWVGELLNRIKEAGLYQRSLIAITGDHGEELFDRGEDTAVEHGHSMHEPVLWVPLLVKWPQGVEADRRIRQTVAAADLHGTMLELAQVPRMPKEERQSLPQRDGPHGDEVFAEWIYYGSQQTALITDDYKVIYHPDKSGSPGEFEVYNHRTDRQELHDLARTSAAADLRARLKGLTQVALETRRLAAKTQRVRPIPLSDKARRDLRSLGYIGDSSP